MYMHVKRHLLSISSFGFLTAFLYLVFSFLARFLFPFGDEPDFFIVADQLLNNENEQWWSPYYWIAPLLQKIVIYSDCFPQAGSMSYWGYINPTLCFEGIEQVLTRFVLTVIVVMPLLLLLVYRQFFWSIFNLLSLKEWRFRLDVLGLSLMVPGMIYYLGLLSVNQFTLVLSLLIFVFWVNWLIVTGLFVWIVLIDYGNSIVIFQFIIFTWFFNKINNIFSLKVSFLAMMFFVCSAYYVGYTFLTYIEDISFIASKATAMLNKNADLFFVEKYPILFRPVITFMTGVFMTPSGLKALPAYFFIGWGSLVAARKIIRKLALSKKTTSFSDEKSTYSFGGEVVIALSALTTVLFFVFLFPDYSNCKYYVFLIPFILVPVLRVIPKFNVFMVVFLSSISVLLNLALYRL